MPRSLSASDRSSLIRLASSLPAGSAERKAILAGLSRTAGMNSSQIKSKFKSPIRIDGNVHGSNDAYFDRSSGKVYLHQKMTEEGGDEDVVLVTSRKFKSPSEFVDFLDSDDGDYTNASNKNWVEVWTGDPSELE